MLKKNKIKIHKITKREKNNCFNFKIYIDSHLLVIFSHNNNEKIFEEYLDFNNIAYESFLELKKFLYDNRYDLDMERVNINHLDIFLYVHLNEEQEALIKLILI